MQICVFNFSVIFFGLLTIGLTYAADKFTSKLVQATGTIWGVIDGPLAGIFIAGFFIPFCNSAVRQVTSLFCFSYQFFFILDYVAQFSQNMFSN